MKRPSRKSKSEIRSELRLPLTDQVDFAPGAVVPINSGGGLREYFSTFALEVEQLNQELQASLSSEEDWVYDNQHDRVKIGGNWYSGTQAERWRQKKALLEQSQMSNPYLNNNPYYNHTAAPNTSSWTQMTSGSGNYGAMPMPANWHSFMCGHQIKLEQGQPVPARCTICPPAKLLVHTYPKCGHALSYQEGTPIPSACGTCSNEAARQNSLRAAEEKTKQEEEQRRREDEKDLRVWLDRQLLEVRVPVAADLALPF